MALRIGAHRHLSDDEGLSMSAHICLQVFIALLIASMVMQWIRARKRRKLVRMVEPASLPDVERAVNGETLSHAASSSLANSTVNPLIPVGRNVTDTLPPWPS